MMPCTCQGKKRSQISAHDPQFLERRRTPLINSSHRLVSQRAVSKTFSSYGCSRNFFFVGKEPQGTGGRGEEVSEKIFTSNLSTHIVALVEEKFGDVRAVLAGNPSDESCSSHWQSAFESAARSIPLRALKSNYHGGSPVSLLV